MKAYLLTMLLVGLAVFAAGCGFFSSPKHRDPIEWEHNEYLSETEDYYVYVGETLRGPEIDNAVWWRNIKLWSKAYETRPAVITGFDFDADGVWECIYISQEKRQRFNERRLAEYNENAFNGTDASTTVLTSQSPEDCRGESATRSQGRTALALLANAVKVVHTPEHRFMHNTLEDRQRGDWGRIDPQWISTHPQFPGYRGTPY